MESCEPGNMRGDSFCAASNFLDFFAKLKFDVAKIPQKIKVFTKVLKILLNETIFLYRL